MTTHPRPSRFRLAHRVALVLLGLLGHSPAAFAQTTISWNGAGSDQWGSATNWSTFAVPNLTNAVVFNSGTLRFNVSLGGTNRTVSSLKFDSTTAFTLSDDTAWLAPGDVTVTKGTGHVISADISLLAGSNPDYDIASGAALTLSGVLFSTGSTTTGLAKLGSGTLILGGTNTFQGTTTISAGTVRLDNAYALQNSTVSVQVDGGLTFDEDISEFYLGGLSGNGDIDLGYGNVFIGSNNASTSYSGELIGAGSITKEGSGTLTLTRRSLGLGDLYFEIDEGDVVFDEAYGELGIIRGASGTSQRVTFRNDTDIVFDDSLTGVDVVVTGASTDISVPFMNDLEGLLVEDGAVLTVGILGSNEGSHIVDGASLIVKGLLTPDYAVDFLISDPSDGAALTFDLASDASLAAKIDDYEGSYGIGSGSIVKTGAGTLSLGRSSSFTGTTSILEGALHLTTALALLNSTVELAVDGGLTFSDGTGAYLIGGLAGSGDLDFGTRKLRVGNNGESTTYTGDITGSGLFSKEGSGTLTFSGNTVDLGPIDHSGGGSLVFDGASGTIGSLTGDSSSPVVFQSGADITADGAIANSRVTVTGAGTSLTTSELYKLARLTIEDGAQVDADDYVGNSNFYTVIDGGSLTLRGITSSNSSDGFLLSDPIDGTALTFDLSEDATFAGSISNNGGADYSAGIGSVEKTGAGTLIFSSYVGYTGGTTISGGTLQIGNGGTSGGIDSNILNNATLVFDRSDSHTYLGDISGSGDVEQAGTGTLIFTGTHTYTGGTTIDTGGTLQLGNGGTSGSIVGNVDNAGTLVFNRSDNVTFDGVVSGEGRLTQAGSGTLILTGDNTTTGGTTITAGGTLQLGNGGTTGSLVGDVANAGTLIFDRSNTLTLAGFISGTGTVEQAGSGTTLLTGENTYSGGTTISAGTLQVGDGTTLGSITGNVANDGALVFNHSDDLTYDGLISGTGSLTQAGSGTLILTADNTFSGGTTIAAGGTLQLGVGGATGSIAGNVTDDGTLVFNRSDSSLTFSGAISGTGSVEQKGGGTLTLSGVNTFTGGTTISAGTLQLGHALALQNSTVSLGVHDGLDLNGFDATLGSLSGSGDLALGSQSLTVGGNGDSTTYSGILSGSGGSLTKAGAGTLILTGDSTFTGGTTISGGTLQLGNGAATGALASGIAISTAGTLTFNRSDSLSFDHVLSGDGALIKDGTNTLTLTGNNTFTGTTTINAGTLVVGNGLTQGSISGPVVNDGALVFDRSDRVTYDGVISGTGSFEQAGSGTLILTGNNSYTGGTTIASGGTLQVGNGGTTGVIDRAIVNQGTLIINRSDDVTYDDEISGTGALVKDGVGTLIFTRNNTYAGTTTVNAGTLQLGTGGSNGTIAGDVINDSALVFNHSNNVTFADVVSGTGSLTQAGTGSLILTGTNTFTGGTTIASGGTLQLGDGGTTGSITGNVAGSGTLVFNRSDNITYAGAISGTVGLTQAGTGRLSLSGASTHSGPTTVSAGTLLVTESSPSALANSAVFIDTNGTVRLEDDGDNVAFTFGSLAGSGTLNLATAYLSAGGDNTDTAFSGSLLDVENDGAFLKTGTGALTLSAADLDLGELSARAGCLVLDGVTGSVFTLSTQSGSQLTLQDVGTGMTVRELNNLGETVLTGEATQLDFSRGLSNSNLLTVELGASVQATATFAQDDQATTVVNQASLTIGGIDYAQGTFSISDAASGESALTIGDNGSDAVVSALIEDYASGPGSITKTGSNTVTLTADNTYTGGTTIDGGTLQLGDGGTTGIVSGDIVNNGTLTFDRSNAVTVSGVISGTGDLAFTGTNTTTLDAANTFTGTTTIESGYVTLGKILALQNSTVDLSRSYSLNLNNNHATLGALSGTGAITVTGGHTLAVGGNGADTLYSGAIQSGGSLRKQGDGTMILTGNNSYGGGTTINGGTLQIGAGGTSGVLPGDVANNAALVFNRSDDLTYAGVISGTGSLTKAGAGTLTLSGANTFTGTTTIDEGAINLSTGDYINYSLQNSTVEVNVDGGLILAGAEAARIGALRGSGNVDLAGNAYELFIGGNGADTTYSGNFINADFAIIYKEGAGTWTLAGSSLDFSNLEVNAGAVVFDGAAGTLFRIANDSGTQVTFQNGAQIAVSNDFAGGSLTITGADTSLSVASNLGGYNSLLVKDGANLQASILGFDGSTPVTVDGATLTIAVIGSSEAGSSIQISDPDGGTALIFDVANSSSFEGTISDYAGDTGTGSGSIRKIGEGTFTLSGANTFSGTTTISGGSIVLGNANALQSSTVDIGVDGGLDLNGFGATIGGLSGTGDLALGSPSLSVGGNDDTTSYSGVFSGAGGLTKTGSGTLTLSGANTHSGGTTISGGTVAVTDESNLGSGTVTLSNGVLLYTGDYEHAADRLIQGEGTIGGTNDVAHAFRNEGTVAATGEGIAFTGYVAGNGDFTGAIMIEGTLAPGASPGTMSFEDLSLTDTSTVEIELAGLEQGVSYDFIDVSGHATLDGTLALTLLDGFELSEGDTFVPIAWASYSGSFDTVTGLTAGDGVKLTVSYLENGLSLTASAVPEPAEYAFGGGLLVLLFALRRRRRRGV